MKSEKKVTLKVANAIAKAGYWGKYGHRCEVQEIVDSEQLLLKADYSLLSMRVPTYMQVWLWLWREKKIHIEIVERQDNETVAYVGNGRDTKRFLKHDPEEAIIAAIEYLITNDLIK